MGRLDMAMRRAEEERAAKGSAATPVTPGWPGRDLPTDFPTEERQPINGKAVAPINGKAADATVTPAQAPAEAPVPAVVSDPAVPLMQPPVAEGAGPALAERIDARLAAKTVVDDTMRTSVREQYRRLAAALHQAQRATGIKVVMIASAAVREGKTLTASNLALTLSESYRRNVLLVDGDLRRPMLHTVFQVPAEPGLSDCIVVAAEPKLPLHKLSPRLTVLSAGRPTTDPIRTLTSERMRRLVDEARDVFDWVIIDTPPVGLLTDAALLASAADGVVLVVRAEFTPYDMVNRAVESIGRDRLLGIVLNRATELPNIRNYDYYKQTGQSTQALTR